MCFSNNIHIISFATLKRCFHFLFLECGRRLSRRSVVCLFASWLAHLLTWWICTFSPIQIVVCIGRSQALRIFAAALISSWNRRPRLDDGFQRDEARCRHVEPILELEKKRKRECLSSKAMSSSETSSVLILLFGSSARKPNLDVLSGIRTRQRKPITLFNTLFGLLEPLELITISRHGRKAPGII